MILRRDVLLRCKDTEWICLQKIGTDGTENMQFMQIVKRAEPHALPLGFRSQRCMFQGKRSRQPAIFLDTRFPGRE
ncbi:hypothetical protein CPY51_19330 [Rhizobium tubonense]|uniref:Uncharacterized protein n=1 Tax=Rhizobium tubonense TaxID=484088 RepID=A0A2W4CHS0_9HYPH|nr:hypothetical protein CPY51_19330 [Rhizobium tubonense]